MSEFLDVVMQQSADLEKRLAAQERAEEAAYERHQRRLAREATAKILATVPSKERGAAAAAVVTSIDWTRLLQRST